VHPEIRSGLSLNMTSYRVDDETNPELLKLRDYQDSNLNRWYLDAQIKGEYPANLVEFYGEKLAKLIQPGDMEKLKIDSEFLGINYYSDSFIGTPNAEQVEKNAGTFLFPINSDGTPPAPYTDMGWPITPVGLEDLLVRIHQDWPEIEDIAITENGAAYDDGPDENGQVNDERRVDYLVNHLDSVSRAIDKGVPVKAYYYWSLLDNFEWAEGYVKRFGIVYVNFETLQRIPKLSANVYSKVIATNGSVLESVRKS
jgi:beta-glucosidase